LETWESLKMFYEFKYNIVENSFQNSHFDGGSSVQVKHSFVCQEKLSMIEEFEYV